MGAKETYLKDTEFSFHTSNLTKENLCDRIRKEDNNTTYISTIPTKSFTSTRNTLINNNYKIE